MKPEPDTEAAARLRRIADALPHARTISPNEVRAPCPAHGSDRQDSLSLHLQPDGISAKCWTRDCEYPAINDAVKRLTGTPLYQPRQERPDRRPLPTAIYNHPDGRERRSYRTDYQPGECTRNNCPDTAKAHKHCWQEPRGAGLKGTLLKLWPPLSDALPGLVIIAEGEKAAAAIQQAGYTAASYIGGSGAAANANYRAVKDCNVLVWPDADTPGRKAAAAAATAAHRAGAAAVRIVTVDPEEEGGQDAADIPPEARAAAIADAINTAPLFTPPPPASPGRPATSGSEYHPDSLDPIYAAGRHYAQTYGADSYRYDRSKNAWWSYEPDTGVWSLMQKDSSAISDTLHKDRYRIAHECQQRGMPEYADVFGSQWTRARRADSPFWAALRNELNFGEPNAPLHLLNTPSGAVDLRTGGIQPHAPDNGCRASTGGNYQPLEAARYRNAVIRLHFGLVLSEPDIDHLIAALGLALSGKAQSYRPLTLFTGASGSGKGGCCAAAAAAAGSYSYPVKSSWFINRPGEIDTVTATLLERKTRLITVDELGALAEGNKSANLARMLSVTGDTEQSARKSYGPMLIGKLIAGIFTSATDPPRMAVADLRRRLSVIPTLGMLAEVNKRSDHADSQDMQDALITLAIDRLLQDRIYEPGYQPPEGNLDAKTGAMAEMDPLNEWLDNLDDSHHGEEISKVRELASNELGYEVSVQLIGRRIKGNAKWTQPRRAGNRGPRRIALRNGEPIR